MHLPETLYRYRRVNENNICALQCGQLWMSTPEQMNDVLDSSIFFDIDKIKEIIANGYESIDSIARALFLGEPIPSHTYKAFKGTEIEFAVGQMLSLLKGDLSIRPYIKRLMDEVCIPQTNRYLESLRSNSIEALKTARRIACFSETISSNKMWGHYSDGHKGFALGYSFRDKPMVCPKHHSDCGNLWMNYPLFPVIYGKEYDGTDYVLYNLMDALVGLLSEGKFTLPFFDWSFFTKGYLYKSSDWEEEKEWRLLSKIEKPGKLDTPFDSIKIEPKEVYLGAKISDKDKTTLVEIAEEKGYKVYQMELKDKTLVPVELM